MPSPQRGGVFKKLSLEREAKRQRITITAAENRSMDDLAELAGQLAAIVEWCVNNDGECLGDHPRNLTHAQAVLAKAKARYDSVS